MKAALGLLVSISIAAGVFVSVSSFALTVVISTTYAGYDHGNSVSYQNNHLAGGGGHGQGHQGAHGHGDYQKDYYAKPHYQYSYGVNDHYTQDQKHASEHRDGENVKGHYALREPDGSWRTVHYVADYNGFRANVVRTPNAHGHGHGQGHGHQG